MYPTNPANQLSASRIVVGAANAFSSDATLLEMQSQSQGFLMPVMTSTARAAIVSPPDGLMVYDSTLHAPYVYSNGAWTSSQVAGQPLAPGITVHTLIDGATYSTSANNTPNVVLNGTVNAQVVRLPNAPIVGQMVTFTQLTGAITTLAITTPDGSTIVPTSPTTFTAGNFITYAYVVLGPTAYWVRVAGNV